MKKIILFPMLFVMIALRPFCQVAPAVTHSATADTSACQLYININAYNADGFTFNMQVNGKPVASLPNGSRTIYSATTSGKITVSDKGHKPFYTFDASPGKKYYIDLQKAFGARYFTVKEYKGIEEIDTYMHFVFWNRLVNGQSARTYYDSKTKDYRQTVMIAEK